MLRQLVSTCCPLELSFRAVEGGWKLFFESSVTVTVPELATKKIYQPTKPSCVDSNPKKMKSSGLNQPSKNQQ